MNLFYKKSGCLSTNSSIISAVGETTVEIIELFEYTQKSPIRTIMKSDQNIIISVINFVLFITGKYYVNKEGYKTKQYEAKI